MLQRTYLGVCKVAEIRKHSRVDRLAFVEVAEGHATPHNGVYSS